MSFETWLTFTAACVVLTLIPGPSVLLIVGQALTKGRAAAMMCIIGDVVGGIVLMALSFMGVGAILATSAVLFQIVKWAGVFYLAYLGYRQLLDAKNEPTELSNRRTSNATKGHILSSNWGSLWAGMITAILNPKAIIFYLAFLTQFINPDGDMMTQVTILISTSTIVVAALLTGYALIAARAGKALSNQSTRKKIAYTGGSCMIGGSLLMATTR